MHIFYRVYLLHSLLLHLSVVLAFVGWEPTHIASISLTHATWKTLRQLVDIRVGHSPRGTDSRTVGAGASMGSNQLQTSHVVHICAYLMVPSVFAAELLWRWVYSTTRPMYAQLVRSPHSFAPTSMSPSPLSPQPSASSLTSNFTLTFIPNP